MTVNDMAYVSGNEKKDVMNNELILDEEGHSI